MYVMYAYINIYMYIYIYIYIYMYAYMYLYISSVVSSIILTFYILELLKPFLLETNSRNCPLLIVSVYMNILFAC